MKTIQIPSDLHKKLKMKAVKEGKTMIQIIIEALTKYVSLGVLLLFVSCASTYTKVDKTNYARYEHDQKIEKGMGMKEVMGKFGSPHDVKNYGYNGEGTTTFVYYRAIQCKSVYCFVVFDDDKEVIGFDEFRQEYVNFLN